MHDPHTPVLGPGSPGAEDELRLPRPPGVFRQFWARHPRFADVLIVLVAFLLTVPSFVLGTGDYTPGPVALVAAILQVVACVALLWRRRFPVTVLIIALVPILVLDPAVSTLYSGPAGPIALYSVAVYRSSRTALWWLAGSIVLAVVVTVVWVVVGPTDPSHLLTVPLATAVVMSLGAVIGVNVGNRKRYIEALIDRSRQLSVERDQQARLAAAAERTRIAREMHDIVSHSLTVVVTLADGAAATPEAERAREANRAIAATAREALTEMRVMLGVLRTDDAADRAPTEPLLQASLADVVATAQAAGAPATLTVSGEPRGSTAHRLAVHRIVREGVTNALRYAPDAGYLRVHIVYDDDGCRVTVENDGARPDLPGQGAGLGLQGLHERVAGLGGTLTAGLVAAGVWRVAAHLPWAGSGTPALPAHADEENDG